MFVLTTTQWRFTYVDLALQPQLPTVLRLTVTDSPRGSPARCETEATVSQTLRTPQLPTAHGLVGYRWQNTGSYSLINARATSCRTVQGTVSVAQSHGGCPLLRRLRTPAGEGPVSAPGRKHAPRLGAVDDRKARVLDAADSNGGRRLRTHCGLPQSTRCGTLTAHKRTSNSGEQSAARRL